MEITTEKITIQLEMTQEEADYLTAAACEFYHKIKDSFEDTTYGALITEHRVIVARNNWMALKAVAE